MIYCGNSRLDSRRLEAPVSARTVRACAGRTSVIDGPFTGTREYLGSFNPIEATDFYHTVYIASPFPCAHAGTVELYSVRDIKLAPHQTGV